MRTATVFIVAFWAVSFERCLAEGNAPAAGLRLVYSGTLRPSNPNADEGSSRSFRIQYLVTEVTAGGSLQVAWLLDEGSGGPRWSWPQRFGSITVNRSLQPVNDREIPAIQAELDEAVRVMALRPPFWPAADRLAADARWEEATFRYEVMGRDQSAGRRAWKVGVSNQQGPREVVWIDEQQPVVVRHRELVFLGQGVAHELAIELDKQETIGAEELSQYVQAHQSLVGLRGPVKEKLIELPESAVPASAELLEKARTAAAAIEMKLESGPYVELAKEIVRATQTAITRQDSLQKFAEELVGKPAKSFSVTTTKGNEMSLADFQGKPLVLHFWEYKSEPKVAPYGETGYLDFLFRQQKDKGVAVLGIAVDERLRSESARATARKDVRAFSDFMNLSYPVAYDDGERKVIDQFGDPRSVGGKLPLYIVIAPDGRVAHYHAGLWSKSADEGLKELDEQLRKAAK